MMMDKEAVRVYKVDFKLEPVDILVNIDRGKSPFAITKRWLIGSYSHIFLYMGQVRILQGLEVINIPMLFESAGRGVVLQSLSNRYGQEVVVRRLKPEYEKQMPSVIAKAVCLASDAQAFYDYQCIGEFVLPRVICEKLHLPVPLKYQRDKIMICSEAIAEVFWRARLDVVRRDMVPMPGDFVASSFFDTVYIGKLSPDWV